MILDPFHEIGVREEHGRPRIGKRILQLFGHQPEIEPYGYRANPRDRKIRDPIFGTVIEQDADPIARRDAEIEEHVRIAIGSLRQFLMAEKIPAVEGQRRVLRQEPCGISERLACEE